MRSRHTNLFRKLCQLLVCAQLVFQPPAVMYGRTAKTSAITFYTVSKVGGPAQSQLVWEWSAALEEVRRRPFVQIGRPPAKSSNKRATFWPLTCHFELNIRQHTHSHAAVASQTRAISESGAAAQNLFSLHLPNYSFIRPSCAHWNWADEGTGGVREKVCVCVVVFLFLSRRLPLCSSESRQQWDKNIHEPVRAGSDLCTVINRPSARVLCIRTDK